MFQAGEVEAQGIPGEASAQDHSAKMVGVKGGDPQSQNTGEGLSENNEWFLREFFQNDFKQVVVVQSLIGWVGDDDRADGRGEIREQRTKEEAGSVKAGEEDENTLSACGVSSQIAGHGSNYNVFEREIAYNVGYE